MTPALALAVLLAVPSPGPSPAAPVTCGTFTEAAALDFWTGEWDVVVAERKVGENRIRKILGGCAITEEWTDTAGGQGFSLFYFDAARRQWKQVWVTDHPLAPGSVKEKRLVETPTGAVRFQGEMKTPSGDTYLDRTTLSTVKPGEVRQLIEISTDGGRTWKAMFDGRYVRR